MFTAPGSPGPALPPGLLSGQGGQRELGQLLVKTDEETEVLRGECALLRSEPSSCLQPSSLVLHSFHHRFLGAPGGQAPVRERTMQT